MTQNFGHKVWSLLGCMLLGGHALAQAVAPIRMLYYERKPFHFSDANGSITGLTATPTAQVFAKAGIPIKWELTPVNRILETLKRNEEAVCTPGWYKNPDREQYARITVPIYRDKAVVGIANKDFQSKEGATAKQLFARGDVRLLTKQNFLFGAYLDEVIGKMPASQIMTTTVDVPNIVKMIHLGRGDLFIITQEEIELYVTQAELKMTDFKVVKFPDVPAVEMRYILCSKLVPPATMDTLNATIVKTVKLSR